mmetsp:Transcript_15415/g.45425  ORF Transcript_15415/g.45425 Transcript_15415/m.45425 type:complete len:266 (-) Transcript_15415:2871-3668(-)
MQARVLAAVPPCMEMAKAPCSAAAAGGAGRRRCHRRRRCGARPHARQPHRVGRLHGGHCTPWPSTYCMAVDALNGSRDGRSAALRARLHPSGHSARPPRAACSPVARRRCHAAPRCRHAAGRRPHGVEGCARGGGRQNAPQPAGCLVATAFVSKRHLAAPSFSRVVCRRFVFSAGSTRCPLGGKEGGVRSLCGAAGEGATYVRTTSGVKCGLFSVWVCWRATPRDKLQLSLQLRVAMQSDSESRFKGMETCLGMSMQVLQAPEAK